jgi:hypothetical protein
MRKALSSEHKSVVSDHLIEKLPAAIDALTEISSSSNVSAQERLAAVSLICSLYNTLLSDAHHGERRREKKTAHEIAKKRVIVRDKDTALKVAAERKRIDGVLLQAEEHLRLNAPGAKRPDQLLADLRKKHRGTT